MPSTEQEAAAVAASDAERAKNYRDNKRGKPPRVPAPCGTYTAAMRHRRRGEPLDAACSVALADYQAEQYRARKARGG